MGLNLSGKSLPLLAHRLFKRFFIYQNSSKLILIIHFGLFTRHLYFDTCHDDSLLIALEKYKYEAHQYFHRFVPIERFATMLIEFLPLCLGF